MHFLIVKNAYPEHNRANTNHLTSKLWKGTNNCPTQKGASQPNSEKGPPQKKGDDNPPPTQKGDDNTPISKRGWQPPKLEKGASNPQTLNMRLTTHNPEKGAYNPKPLPPNDKRGKKPLSWHIVR